MFYVHRNYTCFKFKPLSLVVKLQEYFSIIIIISGANYQCHRPTPWMQESVSMQKLSSFLVILYIIMYVEMN